MNYKHHAEKLETFLKEELARKPPLTVMQDKSIAYKSYIIKQTKQGMWALRYATGDIIDQFRIKTTASLAAKFYDTTNFTRYNEVKNLDTEYWNNNNDADFFKHRYENAKDLDKRDLFLWRWELTRARASRCKEQISSMFKSNF